MVFTYQCEWLSVEVTSFSIFFHYNDFKPSISSMSCFSNTFQVCSKTFNVLLFLSVYHVHLDFHFIHFLHVSHIFHVLHVFQVLYDLFNPKVFKIFLRCPCLNFVPDLTILLILQVLRVFNFPRNLHVIT